MEDKIHKDVKTLFKLKKEIDDKTIKSKWNLFKLKKKIKQSNTGQLEILENVLLQTIMCE